MKKHNDMLDLLPFLDDQGENDMLALLDRFLTTKTYPTTDKIMSDRINRVAEWRFKIISRRKS